MKALLRLTLPRRGCALILHREERQASIAGHARRVASLLVSLSLIAFAVEARASEMPPPELAQPTAGPAETSAPAPATAGAPDSWWDTFGFSGHLEAGITGNPDTPADHRNFGRIFDDHSNVPVLNRLWGAIGRPINSNATDWDFGFKVERAVRQ